MRGRPNAGTPQGGVVSPLLAIVYLHEVLDRWFEDDVKPRLGGRAFMVRFADDVVMVFANERDARRVWTVCETSRSVRSGPPPHQDKAGGVPTTFGRDEPPIDRENRSFDLLGFTHFWARSRRGFWVVKLKTAGDRFGRSVKRVQQWCRRYRHAPHRLAARTAHAEATRARRLLTALGATTQLWSVSATSWGESGKSG